MRAALPLLLLVPALLLAPDPREAAARPPFARREKKACGYCHINPRGGGARNRTGLLYARHEFSFPPRQANLGTFTRENDRAAMVRARKLIDIDHTLAAVRQLATLRANRAPVKLVLPLMLCFAPAALIFLVSPAVLELYEFLAPSGGENVLSAREQMLETSSIVDQLRDLEQDIRP